jgi:hypothetical protein
LNHHFLSWYSFVCLFDCHAGFWTCGMRCKRFLCGSDRIWWWPELSSAAAGCHKIRVFMASEEGRSRVCMTVYVNPRFWQRDWRWSMPSRIVTAEVRKSISSRIRSRIIKNRNPKSHSRKEPVGKARFSV